MNKNAIEHTKDRVLEVVRCTNGTISSKLNKKMKKTMAYSMEEKYALIVKGKATLQPITDLMRETSYNTKKFSAVLGAYTYPETAEQKKAREFNQKIADRIAEAHTEVDLAGKRLVDSIILGNISSKDVPAALVVLGELHKNFA